MSDKKEWYVICTDFGKEARVKRKIDALGLEGIQTCNISRLMTDRVNNVIFTKKRIMFSCYLFIAGPMDAAKYQEISGIEGVRGFIRDGVEPISIMNENIIRLLEIALAYPDNAIPASRIVAGDSGLSVVEGPLTGLEGLIKKTQFRRKRVFLDLALFGESRLVALPATIAAK